MGQRKGHPSSPNVGRKKGGHNNVPDQFVKGSDAEDIRKMLTMAFRDNSASIVPKMFKELSTLEGYAYLSGVKLILDRILPSLQSVELNANVKQTRSLLLERIETLKIQQK